MRIVMHNESVKRINSSLEEEKKQKEDRMLNTYAHKMNERERKLQLKNKEMNDISKRIREGIKNKEDLAKQRKDKSLKELDKMRHEVLSSH